MGISFLFCVTVYDYVNGSKNKKIQLLLSDFLRSFYGLNNEWKKETRNTDDTIHT